jgi:hypothetical protein
VGEHQYLKNVCCHFFVEIKEKYKIQARGGKSVTMGRRILLPQYNDPAAEEVTQLLREEAERAYKVIRAFERDGYYHGKVDYQSSAEAMQCALGMMAHFTPKLVRDGWGLEFRLAISRRGRVDIYSYHPDSEGWIFVEDLFNISNIGPFHTDHPNEAASALGRVSWLFRTLDRILSYSGEKGIPSAKPVDCDCSEACRKAPERAKELINYFNEHLAKGKPLCIEDYNYFNP